MNITVTDGAIEFLKNLLETVDIQDPKGPKTHIKVFVEKGGTPYAETMLTYAKESEKGDAKVISYDGFDLYVDSASEKFLDECVINHDADQFGGQLTIKAPNSKVSKLDENSTLEEKVNYYLYNEVAPMLAQHGGNVRLHEITQDKVAVLEFGGGCQGCRAVDMTLTHGIEQVLLNNVPEIAGIRDMTDHNMTANAYYSDETEANAYGGF